MSNYWHQFTQIISRGTCRLQPRQPVLTPESPLFVKPFAALFNLSKDVFVCEDKSVIKSPLKLVHEINHIVVCGFKESSPLKTYGGPD